VVQQFSRRAFLQVPVKHVVDIGIGANHGIWIRAIIQFFLEAHYIFIEPQDKTKIGILT
jgi:hypothetical protein